MPSGKVARKSKAKYHAKLSRVPQLELGNADIEFVVSHAGEQYGVLAVSRGAAVWRPSRSRFEYRMTWPGLDTYAVDHGQELRRARQGNRRSDR